MATLTQGSMNVLLISCVLSIGISVPSFAEDGVIVTGRNVQAHMYGRAAFGKDPYPTTANANPNAGTSSVPLASSVIWISAASAAALALSAQFRPTAP